MSTKRVLVLGLIAGGLYLAACGSTNSSVGEMASAGASGKTSNGSAGGNAAGASAAGGDENGTSGASQTGAGAGNVAGSGAGATSSGAASAGGAATAGSSSGGATSGGSTAIAGSGGGPDCSTVKCATPKVECTTNQVPIPQGQCCAVCFCPQACANTNNSCKC